MTNMAENSRLLASDASRMATALSMVTGSSRSVMAIVIEALLTGAEIAENSIAVSG